MIIGWSDPEMEGSKKIKNQVDNTSNRNYRTSPEEAGKVFTDIYGDINRRQGIYESEKY